MNDKRKPLQLSFPRISIIIWMLFFAFLAVFFLRQSGLSNMQGRINYETTRRADSENQSEFLLDLSLHPSPSLQVSGTNFSVETLLYKPISNLENEPDELCVEYLRLLENVFDNIHARGSIFLFSDNHYPVCYNISQGAENPKSARGLFDEGTFEIVGFSDSSKDLDNFDIYDVLGKGGTITARNNFIYPYDKYDFEFAILMKYCLKSNGDEIECGVTAPIIDVVNSTDNIEWDITINDDIQFMHIGTAEIINYDVFKVIRTLHLSFSRPIIYQIVYPLILITLLLLIIMLSQSKELSVFMEGSIAILFGLFGLKSLLLPPDAQARTILDPIILVLYVSFGIALLQFLIYQLLSSKRKNANIQKGISPKKENQNMDDTVSKISNYTVKGARELIKAETNQTVLLSWLKDETMNLNRKTIVNILEKRLGKSDSSELQ